MLLKELFEQDSEAAKFGKYMWAYRQKIQNEQLLKTDGFEVLDGDEVDNISALRDNNFLIIKGAFPGVRFVVRRLAEITSNIFAVHTSQLAVSLQCTKSMRNTLILGFQSSLEKLLERLLDKQIKDVEQQHGVLAISKGYFDVVISLNVDSLRTPVNSGRFKLQAKNKPFLIGQLLDALTRTLISSSPQSKLQDLRVTMSVMNTKKLTGDAYVPLLSNSDFEKKSYHPKSRKRASMLLCRSTMLCFFVACHIHYRYNVIRAKQADALSMLKNLPKNKQGKKRSKESQVIHAELECLSGKLLELAEEDGNQQLHKCRLFFTTRNVDVEQLEIGALSTLKILSVACDDMQISIHDQKTQFRRQLIYPEKYSPFLIQINLVRILDISLREGRQRQFNEHYHACHNLTGLTTAQGVKYCLFCGGSFHPHTRLHECAELFEVAQCKACSRVIAQVEDAKLLIPTSEQYAKLCVADKKMPLSEQRCKDCAISFRSMSCKKAHVAALCKRYFTCIKCDTKVLKRGKYDKPQMIANVLIPVTQHDDCLEIFCSHCEDYVRMEENDGVRHVCYIKRPKRAASFPVGLGVFDLEAIMNGQTFEAVTVGCIYQPARYEHNNYKGIFFSEVGDTYNGTSHGTSFDLNSQELRDVYLPSDILKEAPIHKDPLHKFYKTRTFKPREHHLDALPPVKRDADTEEPKKWQHEFNVTLKKAGELSAVGQFVHFIMQRRFRGYTFLSHYGRGYDNLFILAYLLENAIKAKVIFVGNKILSLHIPANDLTLTDMNAYVPMSLRKMGKSFGIECDKDYFPFSMLTRENFNFKSATLPPKHKYNIERFDKVERATFDQWHEKNRLTGFNFSAVIHEYCLKDCIVLMQSVLKFVDACLRIEAELWKSTPAEILDEIEASFVPIHHNNRKYHLVNNHPFSKDFCTASSYCNRLNMSTAKIRLPIYDNQYCGDPFFASSKAEILCMEHFQRTKFPNLQYQLTDGGQKKLRLPGGRKITLDGYDAETKTALEFNGCHWHGHFKCENKTKTAQSAFRSRDYDRYMCTKRRERFIRIHPEVTELIVIWECEWYKMLENDKALKEIVSQRMPIKPATLRECFKGGYCNVTALYGDQQELIRKFRESQPEHSSSDDELKKKLRISLIDVNSQVIFYTLRCWLCTSIFSVRL
jgi:G:T-mismatch repair DNA endonuclease (very short patch repair protein)